MKQEQVTTVFNNDKLKDEFHRLNKELFNNQLPKNVTVVWSNRMTRVAGNFKYSVNRRTGEFAKYRIALSTKFHEEFPEEILDTLIHEMIHLKYPTDDHGADFQAECDRINKLLGTSLSVYTNKSPEPTHQYECIDCHRVYSRYKKVDVNKMKCNCTPDGGQLRPIEKSFHTKI